jgi:hypothetical protein
MAVIATITVATALSRISDSIPLYACFDAAVTIRSARIIGRPGGRCYSRSFTLVVYQISLFPRLPGRSEKK